MVTLGSTVGGEMVIDTVRPGFHPQATNAAVIIASTSLWLALAPNMMSCASEIHDLIWSEVRAVHENVTARDPRYEPAAKLGGGVAD